MKAGKLVNRCCSCSSEMVVTQMRTVVVKIREVHRYILEIKTPGHADLLGAGQ